MNISIHILCLSICSHFVSMVNQRSKKDNSLLQSSIRTSCFLKGCRAISLGHDESCHGGLACNVCMALDTFTLHAGHLKPTVAHHSIKLKIILTPQPTGDMGGELATNLPSPLFQKRKIGFENHFLGRQKT